MTKRTVTAAENPTYYALFRKYGESVEITSSLQDQIYSSYIDAQNALNEMVAGLPLDLKNKIIIQEVPAPTYNPNIDLRWYVALD